MPPDPFGTFMYTHDLLTVILYQILYVSGDVLYTEIKINVEKLTLAKNLSFKMIPKKVKYPNY
jgi:hypothetical protein